MAKVALIALKGESHSWVVDFEAGTVTATKEPYHAKARAAGNVIHRGVDVAVVEDAVTGAASFQYTA